jgi:GT2 family glycosyltransferase
MNKIYIVLVNYNRFNDTVECLESLLKSNYLNFQIFIVDNSVDQSSINYFSNWANSNTGIYINTDFEDLVFPLESKPIAHTIISENEFSTSNKLFEEKITIVTAINNGFAAANNIILNYILKNGAPDCMIWMLNNDTVVKSDTLTSLVNFYKNNVSTRYILGSKLMYYHSPHKIQAIAGEYNKWIGKHTHVGDGEEDRGQFDNYKPGEMSYIVGASMFFPKLFLEENGLISEEYFLYFEELDWMQKGIKNGYKIAFVPNAIVYHKEGASTINQDNKKRTTSIADYYSIINRVRFIKKWYPYCLFTVMGGVVLALAKRTMWGEFSFVKRTGIAVFKILIAG